MAWTIRLTAEATRQLERLDKPVARRIRDFLSERLALVDDPRSLGKPLRGGEYQGFLRYRVGDYRIICNVQDAQLVIVVIELGHRSQIYR